LILFLNLNIFALQYPEAYALEQTLLVQKIATEHHGSDFVFVEEPDAKQELWKVSRAFYLKSTTFCALQHVGFPFGFT
jgi:hypothetical protein